MKRIPKFLRLSFTTGIIVAVLVACGENEKLSERRSECSTSLEKKSVAKLRSELSTPGGSSAFCDLHHLGEEGFEALLRAFASGEISPDNFISWSFDLETRWPDGAELGGTFLRYLSASAGNDPDLAAKLADFYAQFPDEMLEALKQYGSGAEEVARMAEARKKQY